MLSKVSHFKLLSVSFWRTTISKIRKSVFFEKSPNNFEFVNEHCFLIQILDGKSSFLVWIAVYGPAVSTGSD